MQSIIQNNRLKRKKNKKKYDKIAYFFIAPFMIFMVIFVYIPIIINILLSFTNYDLSSMEFVGLSNYRYLLKDKYFIISLRNTGVFTFLTLFASMFLGLLLAVFLKRKVFGLKFHRTAFYLPYVVSMVSVSMVWLWIYEPSNGLLNNLIAMVGMKPKEWLYDTNLAIYSVVVMSIWKGMGYNMLIYLAGLQGIPSYIYEASVIDGANGFQQFIHITVPMLKPVTFFLFVTGVIKNFNVFEQIIIMTGGGPVNSTTTMVHQIYDRAFEQMSMGYAASMSVILLIIISIITFININYGNKQVDVESE